MTIEYDGTGYFGWQRQKNTKFRLKKSDFINNTESRNSEVRQDTIQATIERSIYKITGEKVNLIGSGRTDAGVHAVGQVANFKTKKKLKISSFLNSINGVLPSDILIKKIENVSLEFNSRFSAKSKRYRYNIVNSKFCSPFYTKFFTHIPFKMDFSLIEKEVMVLKGKHDFKSFQASDKKNRNSIREVYDIFLKKENDLIVFEIEANGFLYKMVRNIAGTFIEIGRGKFSPGSMKKILESRQRNICGPTADATGLFLINVNY